MLRSPPEPGQFAPREKRHKRGQPVPGRLAHQVHAHRIAAQGEEYAVPQREHTGIAPDQIEGHGDNCVAEDLADERQHPRRNGQRMRCG